MTIKIIKIDGDFAIVEIENGEQRVCPVAIFPKNIIEGTVVIISKKEK